MGKNTVKAVLLLLVPGLILLFFVLDMEQYISLSGLKHGLVSLKSYYQTHVLGTMAVYMGIYIALSALSLPGAAVLTIAGGALFGIFYGVILASFASTMGATLAFWFSRHIFRDFIRNRFSDKAAAMDRAIEKEGGFYLFALRLVPVFPFFIINLAMGLTKIKTSLFYLVSQAGMLPGTILYVNAGTRLAEIDTPGDILSAGIIISFALLGIFPMIAKRFVSYIRARKELSGFSKPASFDYNIVVIGAGSAGLVSALVAAFVKAKVALVEKNKMGGECLNTGCVPSKALIASSKLIARAKRAEDFGFNKIKIDFEFSSVMARVQSIIKKIEPHDSIERFTNLGVDCIKGKAEIISPFEVKVQNRILTTKNIIIATGAKPMIPDIKGLNSINYLTSENIWYLKTIPPRLLVLGGGPMGCELAQAFSRMGSKVTIVQRGRGIMKREDRDVADIVDKSFQTEGIKILLNRTPEEIDLTGRGKKLVCTHEKKKIKIEFDEILIALGRLPNVEGFGLKKLGVKLSRNKSIKTNEFLETNIPNIHCCGDVHGKYQFTHTAAHEAWYAAVNSLFGKFKKTRVDYNTIPWATYTDPEIARVGLNETEAEKKGILYETVKFELKDLDRAITDSEDNGFIKVLTMPGKDKILGVTIVGHHASDMIAEYILAMKHGLGLNKILGTIHIYPTMAEANKYAAGIWKKNHAPGKLLALVEKYHAWMRRR